MRFGILLRQFAVDVLRAARGGVCVFGSADRMPPVGEQGEGGRERRVVPGAFGGGQVLVVMDGFF